MAGTCTVLQLSNRVDNSRRIDLHVRVAAESARMAACTIGFVCRRSPCDDFVVRFMTPAAAHARAVRLVSNADMRVRRSWRPCSRTMACVAAARRHKVSC